MNAFTRSISQIFKGAAKAFQNYPATIACALAFAIVTMIRIQLDWPEQEAYNFLFNCLHWAFALGAIFSLAAITAAHSRYNHAKAFLIANLLGALVVLAAFFALYLFGGTVSEGAVSRGEIVSGIAASRVLVLIFISFLAFIIFAGYPKDRSDFARSFFMTHKAFFIALIYGAVIMGGTSGVAGAIQSLLYHEMSEKVYMYLATVSGFLAFTIFVGYFPNFRNGALDEHRDIAQKQPRFIEVLFGSIMIPIVLALTAVLLIWAGKTILTGTWPDFIQLSSIATSFALGGIWLHVMVTHYESALAKFYRRIYPIAALVILAFEAWALLLQLEQTGLKTAEYFFALIWIVAVVAAILLLIMKAKAHTKVIVLICALAVFAVLPVVGYHALPVTFQVHRLENLLTSQGMLEGDKLLPASTEPELAIRESITDAVAFLASSKDTKLPAWFDKSLDESSTFKAALGFDQTWPEAEDIYYDGSSDYLMTSLMLQPGAADISDYRWVVNLQDYEGKDGEVTTTIGGDKGDYTIIWWQNYDEGIPSLKVLLDDELILEQDMNAYLDQVTSAFPPGTGASSPASFDDMSLQIETPDVTVLLVFSNVEINVDTRQDRINYWLNLSALYLRENP